MGMWATSPPLLGCPPPWRISVEAPWTCWRLLTRATCRSMSLRRQDTSFWSFFIVNEVTCHLKIFLWHFQESIHGICKNDYIQIKDVHTGVVTLRRIVDLQSCRVRAVLDTGMASAVPNALSRTVWFCHTYTHAAFRYCRWENKADAIFACRQLQVGSSIETNVHYNYTLRPGKLGLVISEVFSQENQQSTPFNLKTGHLTAATQ